MSEKNRYRRAERFLCTTDSAVNKIYMATKPRCTLSRPLNLAVAFLLLLTTTLVSAQDEPAMDGMGNMSSDPFAENTPTVALYNERCAQCHENATGRVPPRASLRYRPAEGIYAAMRSGVMAPMAEGLSDEQMISLVKLLTGNEPKAIPDPNDHLCASSSGPVGVTGDDWPSIHGDIKGHRFRQFSGLDAASVDQLQLKWAYAIPGSAKGPVTIADNTLYLSGTGYVIALSADSGCVKWAFPVHSRSVRAVTVEGSTDIHQKDSRFPSAVAVFGDDAGTVFALDASTGEELWNTRVENHLHARITAAPTVHAGIVYVPISSLEDPLTHDEGHFCCSGRGGVAAVDLHTDKQLWKQQHITAPLAPIQHEQDIQHAKEDKHHAHYFDQGPAGASTYTPLTIDARRGLLYASTAEEYGFTGAAGPYSVIAYDLKTGKRAWQHSLLPTPEQRKRICAARETDCRNMFSSGTSVLIYTLSNNKDILVVGQKSGVVHGLDPDNGGKKLWSTQVADGGDLGGVMYALAADDNNVYVPVSDVDSPSGRFTGSLVAIDPASGIVVWRSATPEPACNWTKKHCIGGQVAAVTVVSNMVFTGSWDGNVRIYAAEDGRLVREMDTAIDYPAVNGVANGGQVSGYPVSVGKDAIYINSGSSSIMKPGNALLVYTLGGK